MVDWFLSQVLLTLNWLALIVVAGAPFAVASSFERLPFGVRAIIGLLLFAAAAVGLYFLYPIVGFPFWMRWPHEWLGRA
jgi:hypothetical protein